MPVVEAAGAVLVRHGQHLRDERVDRRQQDPARQLGVRRHGRGEDRCRHNLRVGAKALEHDAAVRLQDLDDVMKVPRAGAGRRGIAQVGGAVLAEDLIDGFPGIDDGLAELEEHAAEARVGEGVVARAIERWMRRGFARGRGGHASSGGSGRGTCRAAGDPRGWYGSGMDAEAVVAAERAVDAAYGASQGAWRRDGRLRAAGLRAVAEGLARAKDEIVREASRESALTAAELAPEFARMTRTLRMFAEVVEDPKGLWRRPTVDAPAKNDADAIGPNHDLRAMLIARRGCAVVFGASNFPLAYGAVGGDAASALAAGLGVVVKEHPAQPRTGRLLARIAREALTRAGCNADVLGYAREAEGGDGREVAAALVGHPLCAAVGFTGSRGGGEAVEALARARATPIPVFAEMGSTNPVFVTRGALEERGAAIAQEIGGSLLARHGQQCTCPGVIVLGAGSGLGAVVRSAGGRDAAAEEFEGTLARMVARAAGRAMLSPLVRERYVEQVSKVASFQPEVTLLAKGEDGGEGAGGARAERAAPAMLFAVDEMELRSVRFLSEEAFGPAAVVTRMNLDVDARGELDGRVVELLELMEGQLAASVYATRAELADAGSGARRLMEVLTEFAGRVVVNGVTTGVRVAAGMVHGGPRPAASGGEWTAVGPRAIERWCRWVCVQNWPREALGAEVG